MWIKKLNWKYERTSVTALNRLLPKALASTLDRVFSISSIIKRIIICLIRWQLQFIRILVDSSLTFGCWCRGSMEEFITWWKNENNLVTISCGMFHYRQKRVTDKVNMGIYYSTIASFYHIWSRERAKYETVIHFSVPVWPVSNRANTDGTVVFQWKKLLSSRYKACEFSLSSLVSRHFVYTIK